jgi:pantetheine-phosphate adenylyltransferase
MNVKAIYPGSFDPITFGHIDLIERMSPLYDELVVLISNSPTKSYLFTAQERAELVRSCLDHLPQVNVQIHDGLTVDCAKKFGANVILRGLRAVSDFEYESAMANTNKMLAPDIETLIVFTRPEYSYISSRMVKEVATYSDGLQGLVPPLVAKALKAHKKQG